MPADTKVAYLRPYIERYLRRHLGGWTDAAAIFDVPREVIKQIGREARVPEPMR
jgi:hypothetical protein